MPAFVEEITMVKFPLLSKLLIVNTVQLVRGSSRFVDSTT